jgi:multiple sugar transport system ATP-binding protein
MAEVALRQVVKKFGDVEAVRSIDLDIPDNEFVVWLALPVAAKAQRCG